MIRLGAADRQEEVAEALSCKEKYVCLLEFTSGGENAEQGQFGFSLNIGILFFINVRCKL